VEGQGPTWKVRDNRAVGFLIADELDLLDVDGAAKHDQIDPLTGRGVA
jgi:hypothetical protein